MVPEELPGIQEGVSSKEKERLAKIDTQSSKKPLQKVVRKHLSVPLPQKNKSSGACFAFRSANQVSRSGCTIWFWSSSSNKGIGAGAGLEKWLNDTNSLTVNAGLAGGNPVFEFGIKHEFMKTADSQLSGKAWIDCGRWICHPIC